MTRCAAGVEHAEQIVTPGSGVLDRCAVSDQRLVAQRARRQIAITAVDDGRQARKLFAQCRNHRRERVVDEQHPGVGFDQ